MNRDEAIEMIKDDEGFSHIVYLDTNGFPTVGWGHAFLDSDSPRVGTRFTKGQCEEWFQKDFEGAEKDYERLNLNLDETCKWVVVMMLFNLGLTRFLMFKNFIAALRRGDKKLAGFEMLDSKWHREDVGQRAVKLARMVFNS